MEGNVQEQQSLKNWQATTHGLGGYGSAFLGLAGAFIGGQAGEVMKQLSNLSQPAIGMFTTHLDGKNRTPFARAVPLPQFGSTGQTGR